MLRLAFSVIQILVLRAAGRFPAPTLEKQYESLTKQPLSDTSHQAKDLEADGNGRATHGLDYPYGAAND